MSEFTFLTKEQIDILENHGIFYKHRKAANITDFASLLVCFQHKDGLGKWWTKTTYCDYCDIYDDEYDDDEYDDDDVCVINEKGMEDFNSPWSRFVGARPAFSISSIISKQRKKELEDSGVKEFEYGEYPQTIVDEEYSKELEKLYSSNGLIITGRNYTTDSAEATDGVSPFKAKIHIEYEYNGRQYIRFVYDDSSFYGFNLSDGRKLERGKIYWVAVEPIVWLLDVKADIALSKNLIFSGVQFENGRDYYGDFEKSNIKKFMDKYLSKEIVADRTYPKVTFESQAQENIENKRLAEKQISDAINFGNNSEESTENKELVEEQVSNTSNFDDVSGKDIDNKKSVANKTSDDFDFVNVPEENIENKEPDETQIFGAINFDNNSEEDTESKESFANKTSNDFDSVPEEDTESKELAEKQVSDTVNFADDSEEETETKIHPYVYAYIAYKSYSGNKLNVELKKWEMVSKVLYKTKQPDVLRELLGDDLTNDFIAFTNQQVISLEDVINHNYSKEDLEMNTSQKFATAASLAFVNDEHFGAVRDFMKQVGTTSMSVFEFMWAYGDESRLEKIVEAQMIDGLSQRKTKVRRKRKN